MINFLEESEYFLLHKKLSGGHWKPDNLIWRWAYHAATISIAKGLKIEDASNVLEIGTAGISIVHDSHTLDHPDMYDFPGKRPTYSLDARNVPWPIAEKRYDLAIALRMFQHISPFQRKCFLEAKRVSKKLLIVVPQFYDFRKHDGASGIHYAEFFQWNNQVHPNLFIRFRTEDLYFWDFEKPSRTNLFYDSISNPVQSNILPDFGIVEIVGPNAVGKTSLKDAIVEYPCKEVKFVDQKMLANLFNTPEVEVKGAVKSLIFEKYKRLKSGGYTSDVIQRSIAHSLRVIGNEFLMGRMAINSLILVDDGMLTNFAPQLDSIILNKKFLMNKRSLVIVLNCSTENLLKRILNRRIANPNATPYFGLTGSDLELAAKKAISFFQLYSQKLRDAGFAVIEADGNLPVSEQCRLVSEEIKTKRVNRIQA